MILKQTFEQLEQELKNTITNEVKNNIQDFINDKKANMFLPITFNINNVEIDLGKKVVHEKTPLILKMMINRINTLLVGESGCGKTEIVKNCAAMLNKNFYCMSLSNQTTQSSLTGYMDATGKYVSSLFRQAYENGGIFCLDEIDNGNANVLSLINSAISNDVCAFPDKMINKHPDFVLMATANTIGLGADRKYVGRQELDLATIDRFVNINVSYDKKLEDALIQDNRILLIAWAIRDYFNEIKSRNIVSTRGIINLHKLNKIGIGLGDSLNMTLLKNSNELERQQAFNLLKEKDLW